MDQDDGAVRDLDPLIVGTTVPKGVQHPLTETPQVVTNPDYTCNATHRD
jgi:hypothetical protein